MTPEPGRLRDNTAGENQVPTWEVLKDAHGSPEDVRRKFEKAVREMKMPTARRLAENFTDITYQGEGDNGEKKK